MGSFQKLFPYVWPFRKQLLVSVVLGLLVAVLWGANLSLAFPVIKILLEQKNLHDYVDDRIENAQAEEAEALASVDRAELEVRRLRESGIPATDPAYTESLRKQARANDKLTGHRREHYQFQWLQSYVMPVVPKNEFKTLFWLLVIVILATAVKGVFIFLQEILVGRVAESAVMKLRKDMFGHVLKLDYQSLSNEGTSGLMSRFTYDGEQLSQGITLLGGRLIREPLKCLSCMVLALMINWRLTLLSIFFIPLLGLFLSKFGSMLKRASRRMMESMSQIYKVLEESFSGLKVVIAFNNQRHHEDQFERQYQSYFKKSLKVVKIDAAAKPLLELLGLTAMFVAVIPGTYLVLRGKEDIFGVRLSSGVMSSAELATLYFMLVGMLDPCRKMSSTFSRLKRSAAAVDRIFDLMNRQTLIADPEVSKSTGRHEKTVEFRDISFRYECQDPKTQRGLVLEHVDLTVNFGEVVAIVGQNGCGKSTLVNLLPRFYDPENGSVLLDGVPITDIKISELRNQVGIVTQETMLFDESILENIRYGTPDATHEEVEHAARQAHVWDIIQSLPQGLETVIGDKGKELSGGQRQRIALARVILKDPAILILDEATSAADAESETFIHETLKTFVKGRTTFMISHTISNSLLDFVTRIVVMEKGSVIASGSHEQLLETCPIYHRLYHSPSRVIGKVA
ncbi:ABC transporter ATP-binding protein [Thalassoglobus polymorphus]|uniref:Lipid A export ATP-binding/permease protein MsbA n=1 Tax=Thalassoglobus polymorphus TaxID=2527994 RepID=A0A517QIX8_9PLAN|nr:ABC transporter ATP-binding protein [Thalassoglobus polymorphus]QDT31535.1 Lipid A export ATP-binding/permease protein MsbA [Thalassoglobus polymorphus]